MEYNYLINKIFNENCLVTMSKMPNDFINLVVTSPSYDQLRKYSGDNKLDWEEHVWKPIIQELFRVIRLGGIVVWVVGDSVINGSESGTSFKQALYFKDVGFNLYDTMIYQKENPVPLTHNRYEQAFEYMFVFSKGKPKTFNPILEDCKTKGYYKTVRSAGRVKENSFRSREEIVKTKDTKVQRNIWTYIVGGKTDNGRHPASFPEKLVIDYIIS